MITDKISKQALVHSGICTGGLSLLFVFFSWKQHPRAAIFIALPYFIVLYFIFFCIGRTEVSDWLRVKLGRDIRRIVIFPAVLIVLYYSYVVLNGKNPLQGALLLLPYLIFFPVLVFAAESPERKGPDWLDFTTFILFFFPMALLNMDPSGDLPFTGGGFGSVYRIVIMLTAVFAFGTVRNLGDIGFYPLFKWSYLFTAIGVWMAFCLFVLIVGVSVDFIRIASHPSAISGLVNKIAMTLVAGFLHTAIFEELVFRGLLQNMLGKRIGQSGSWKGFWYWGGGILFLLSLLAGYVLKGDLKWFPALVTLILFAAAFGIEKAGKEKMGVYTALAITSAIFGLVHFHTGSIIYIGFAIVAGWAYGYTYIRTKNVFYSALVHTLVNSSALIFGFELVK